MTLNPDELLEQLKTTATPRRSKNLDIVHTVCREQYERGSKDFSVATIARIASERGGPARQSIHNKDGDAFKGLIAAWAKCTGGLNRKPRKVSEGPISAILERISDPAVRAVMAAVLAENRKLRSENNILKNKSNYMIDRRPLPAVPASKEVIQIIPASYVLNDSEKEALRHSISDKLFKEEGWIADDNGRVMIEKNKRVIQKVGFVAAIRKMLGE